MLPLSILRFISVATSYLGLGEEPGPGLGRMVDTFLREVGHPPGGPWDTAFVHHVGYWSQYDNVGEYSPWPLPRTPRAGDIAAFARERGIAFAQPQVGDISLIAGARRDTIVRTGIVVALRGSGRDTTGRDVHRVTTIEGNAGPAGRPGGHTIARVQRDVRAHRGDLFVRWVELDARDAPARGDGSVALEAGRYTMRRFV